MGWRSVAKKLLTLCGLRVTNTKRQRQASEEAARKIGKEFHKKLKDAFSIPFKGNGPSLPGEYPHTRTGYMLDSLVTAVTANPATGGYQIHTGFTPEFVDDQIARRITLFDKKNQRKGPAEFLRSEYDFQITSEDFAVQGFDVAVYDSRSE